MKEDEKKRLEQERYKKQMRSVRRRVNNPNLWKPGEPLTAEDQKLLEPVIKLYEKQGFSPRRKEVPNGKALRQRFRIWDDVLKAASLPKPSEPEQLKKRQEYREWNKNMKETLNE